MTTVWKYPFPITDEFSLDMPFNAEIVLVGVQPDAGPCMWARVDTFQPTERRWFRVTGTGHEVPPMSWHIGSFQMPPFVWHLWGAVESHEQRERQAVLRRLRVRQPAQEAKT